MAKPLGAAAPKKNNVTKLPTRAAQGAGKSKPSAPPKAMKPGVPEPVRKASNPDQEIREANQLKLVGLRQRHRDIDTQIEAVNEELRELRSKKKEIRSAVQTIVPLKLFDEAYEDAGTSRVDLDQKELLRALIREAYGLAVAPQGDLLDKVAAPAKPAVYWEAQGYQDGIAGKYGEVPPECPPENGQDYLRGIDMATERNAKGVKALADAPAAPAPQAPDDTSDRDPADGPEVSPREEGDGSEDASPVNDETAPDGDEAPGTAPKLQAGDPGFTEATPDELAGQKPRQVLEEVRKAEGGEILH